MKYIKRFIILIVMASLHQIAGQSTVYVQTNQFGRGILKIRGDETFVITPEHLLKEYYGPITIFGEGNNSERAELLKSYAGDLAILQFSSSSELNSKKWQLNKDFITIVDNIFEGYLELREQDGSSSKVAVSIAGIDVQYITVRPKDFREKFYQGMSGSSLFVEYQGEKVFLGMLQSIEDDETGSVIRADEMEKLLEVFFNPIKQEKRSNVITDKNLTKKALDYQFSLLNINKSGDRVSLTFDITSLGKDNEISMNYRDITIYVDDGSEYHPKTISIGNKTSHNVNYNLIDGIPVPLTFVFNGVSTSSKFATLLQLKFSNGEVSDEISYRDLYFGDDTEAVEEIQDWKMEDLGFEFSLKGFQKIGNDVVFNFTVSSLVEDKSINFNWSKILLYDDQGLETKAKQITIGNKSRHIVDYNLVQGIKVPMSLLFKEVASSAKGVALLKVGFSDSKTSSQFQLRNLIFPEKTTSKPAAVVSQNNIQSKKQSSLTNCSEIYFYRKSGMLECTETVYLYNHGELLGKLQPGVRFKTVVCNDRSFKFSVRTNPNEVALFSSTPDIEMGKKYYLKISCAMGVSTISLMDEGKGSKDISNNKKFKRKLSVIPLNEY